MRALLAIGCLVLLRAAAGSAPAGADPADACVTATKTNRYADGQTVGRLDDPRLAEISGIAASRRHDGLYWIHNDSGDGPNLYAIDATGNLLGTVVVDDAVAFDWEDIAAFERDGKPYLLIGDIGDNYGLRPRYELIAIEEPEPPADSATPRHVQSAWRVHFRYADGPRDGETLAVDTGRDRVLLLSKRRDPPQLASVPLHPDGEATRLATPLGALGFPGADPCTGAAAPTRVRPTGFAISPDGREAAVVGYREVWIYRRRDREDWVEALARAPAERHSVGLLPQPEAVDFDRDGRAIVATGEKRGSPILRFARPGH